MKQFGTSRWRPIRGALITAVLCSVTSLAPAGELPLELRFDDDTDMPFLTYRQIEFSVTDAILRGEITGNDPSFQLAVMSGDPVNVTMRMRSGEGAFDRMEIFWKTPMDASFSQDRAAMFPLEHDMVWRDYEFPLPVVEGPAILRFDPGWKPGIVEIESIRIESLADPAGLDERISALPESIELSNGTLDLRMAPASADFQITDNRTGRSWELDPSQLQSRIIGARRTSPESMELTLIDLGDRTEYRSVVSLRGESVHFTVESDHTEALFWGMRHWPPPIRSELSDGRIVFVDRSSGTLIDQHDSHYANRELTIYGNTQATDMPFVALFDWDSGDGVLLLAETPADGHFVLGRESDGLIWPRIRWRQSMDTFRYQREFSYRFSAADGYVGLARLYREYAKETGRHKSLREKAAEIPYLDNLMGGALIWGSNDVNDFIAEARTRGILRAGLGNASHGLRDRENGLRRLNEMGYVTFDYDSFSDIVDGPTGSQSDDVDETAYHARPGLGPKGGWINPDGSRYSERSSAFALRAIQSYVPPQMERYGFNGRFIDVSMAIDLQEDWHPEHTFDRRQDMEYKREAFAWYRSLGVVIGTEHGNDWGMDLVDFTEGSAGSPLHWERQGNWWSGGLTRPESEDVYTAEWLKYGNGYHTSVPMWQLVYQDSVINSWYWGDTPGMHYWVAPWIADRKDLFAILYGSMTLLWRDSTDYDWIINRDRFLQSYHDTAHLQGAVAYAPMLSHRFVTGDKAVQESLFGDGTTVVVNFGQEPRPYTTSDGRDVMLAPIGYWAEGPRIHQSRVIEDGQVVKRIETSEFRQYETERRRTVGPVELEGSFTAFAMPEGNWQLVLDPDRLYKIDVVELTGWPQDTDISVYELDELSVRRRIVPVEVSHGSIQLRSGHGERFFSIEPRLPQPTPLVYPPEGELFSHDIVIASHPNPDAVIRHTLDGTMPTRTSPRVPRQGFALDQSATVTLKGFVNDLPVGEPSSADYRLVHRVHHSDVFRSGEEARYLNVSVRDATELRLRIGIGGDTPWADFVDIGYPTLVRADGSEVSLTSLEPVSSFQVYEEPTLNERDDDEPLVVGGRIFTRGIGLRSEAELVYQLDGEFDRLSLWYGINDRAADNPALIQGSAELFIDALPR